MDKWEKHLGNSSTLELKDKEGVVDEFRLKPLSVKYLPKFMSVMGKINVEGGEAMFEEKTSGVLIELIIAMVKGSYPEMEDEKIEMFAMANFTILMEKLVEMHNFGQESNSDMVKEKMEAIKKAQDESTKNKG